MLKKKLVCRGLGSDKWVGAGHLTESEHEAMVNLFMLSDLLRDEGIITITTSDASGGETEYRMDYHTDAERETIVVTQDDFDD